MDLVTAFFGLTLMVGGLIGFAWYVFGREVDHLAGMFRPPDLGWPRGVQEEDPPPAWNVWPHASPMAVRVHEGGLWTDRLPARSPVSARVGRGSSRRHGRW